MIDEPELGLHPENQIKMARALVRLVNSGVKVWITTHSDYIIKEINNMLMLSSEMENREALMEELGYERDEILQKRDFRGYLVEWDATLGGGKTRPILVDEFGMVESSFDETIVDLNQRSRKINNLVKQSKTHSSDAV